MKFIIFHFAEGKNETASPTVVASVVGGLAVIGIVGSAIYCWHCHRRPTTPLAANYELPRVGQTFKPRFTRRATIFPAGTAGITLLSRLSSSKKYPPRVGLDTLDRV